MTLTRGVTTRLTVATLILVVAAALLMACAAAPEKTEQRTARSTLVIGIDVSGSFRKSHESSIEFMANYIYAHLRGLGGLKKPTAVFVGAIGGERPQETKSFPTDPHVPGYERQGDRGLSAPRVPGTRWPDGLQSVLQPRRDAHQASESGAVADRDRHADGRSAGSRRETASRSTRKSNSNHSSISRRASPSACCIRARPLRCAGKSGCRATASACGPWTTRSW